MPQFEVLPKEELFRQVAQWTKSPERKDSLVYLLDERIAYTHVENGLDEWLPVWNYWRRLPQKVKMPFIEFCRKLSPAGRKEIASLFWAGFRSSGKPIMFTLPAISIRKKEGVDGGFISYVKGEIRREILIENDKVEEWLKELRAWALADILEGKRILALGLNRRHTTLLNSLSLIPEYKGGLYWVEEEHKLSVPAFRVLDRPGGYLIEPEPGSEQALYMSLLNPGEPGKEKEGGSEGNAALVSASLDNQLVVEEKASLETVPEPILVPQAEVPVSIDSGFVEEKPAGNVEDNPAESDLPVSSESIQEESLGKDLEQSVSVAEEIEPPVNETVAVSELSLPVVEDKVEIEMPYQETTPSFEVASQETQTEPRTGEAVVDFKWQGNEPQQSLAERAEQVPVEFSVKEANLEVGNSINTEGRQYETSELVNRLHQEGLSLADEGKVHEAAVKLSAVAEFDEATLEQKTLSLYNRGVMHATEGKLDAAIDDFSAVLSLTGLPHEWEEKTKYNRGITYSQKNDFSLANDDFSSLISMKEISPLVLISSYYYRGMNYADMGKHEEAIGDFTHMLGMEQLPSEARSDSLFNRALVYHRMEKLEEAIRDYNEFEELGLFNPKQHRTFLFNRGNAWLTLGNYDQAVKDFTGVIQLPELSLEHKAAALNNRAMAYVELWEKEKALADFNEVMSFPNQSEMIVSLKNVIEEVLEELNQQ